MRRSGRLVEWNDAWGFGLVQADGIGKRVSVHISAWQPRPGPRQRPQLGMPLTFKVGVEQGKPRALAVRWQRPSHAPLAPRRKRATTAVSSPGPVRQRPRAHPVAAGRNGRYTALWVLATLWGLVAVVWGVPRWVAWVYAGLSLWCFAAYWHDKRQAQSGGWRTPESTLHLLALLGGWPGALLAQQWLRHKSSKRAFRAVFWATVVLNLLALLGLLSPSGHAWVQRMVG